MTLYSGAEIRIYIFGLKFYIFYDCQTDRPRDRQTARQMAATFERHLQFLARVEFASSIGPARQRRLFIITASAYTFTEVWPEQFRFALRQLEVLSVNPFKVSAMCDLSLQRYEASSEISWAK